MKTTDFIKESIGQDADEMHRDHEVQMARSDCYNAAKYAIELHKMLHHIAEQQGLEGWVSEKITLANDYLRTVWEYLRHEGAMDDQQEMPVFSFESASKEFDNLLKEDLAEETAPFGMNFAEQLAQMVFDHNPNLDNEDAILNLGYNIAKNELGSRAQGIFRDEDFPSDFVSAYGYLKKQGVAEAEQAIDEDAVDDFLAKGGQVQTGKYHKPRKSEKTDYGSRHIGGAGDKMKASRTGTSAKNQGNKIVGMASAVKESASVGGVSAGAFATGPVGSTGKPGTGKPKSVANSVKSAKPKFGKGIY